MTENTVNSVSMSRPTLAHLSYKDSAVVEFIDLPPHEADHLMVLGFLPGHRVEVGLSAPGGDPRVYRVDGSEVALRRETALRIPISGLRKGKG